MALRDSPPPRFWPGFISDGFLGDLALNSLICVAIFFFLGGYGLEKRMASGEFRYGETTLGLLKQFWKVFFVFVPIGYIFFARSGDGINDLTTRFNIGNSKDFIKLLLSNFSGYDTYLNSEWWFLTYYICTLALGAMFWQATKRHKHYLLDAMLVLFLELLSLTALPGLVSTSAALGGVGENFFYQHFINLNTYAFSFFMGIVFSRYGLLEKLKRRIAGVTFPLLLSVAGIVAIYCYRAYVTSGMDTLTTPLMIAFISVLLDCARPLKACFKFLGKHSMNIWLIHSFYCYYFLEATELVYSTQNVWVDLLILLALSLASSILLNLLYSLLGKIWMPLRAKKLELREKALARVASKAKS